jgi:hypothetical protein
VGIEPPQVRAAILEGEPEPVDVAAGPPWRSVTVLSRWTA